MSYKFIIDGDVFIGRTVPGAARMRVDHENNRFVAAFDPDSDTLVSDHPKGVWADVAADVDPELLQRLEPDVIDACRERLAWIKQSNESKKIYCPRCDSVSNAKILYGLPDLIDEDLKADLDSGRCVLGGRVTEGDDPTRECRDCGYRWVEDSDLSEGDDPAGITAMDR